MRRWLLLLLAVLALGLAACGGDDDDDGDSAATEPATTESAPAESAGECKEVEAPEPKPDGGQKAPKAALEPDKRYSVKFETSCGAFTVAIDQKTSPKTAASFVALAKSGFFDDTIFHRVVPGFVIQGGDPTGTGTGGPGYSTVDKPPADAAYTRGVVAMAKTGTEAPGTSGSQFYVVTGDDAGLPPEYAVLGKVSDGLEVTAAIDALGVGDGPPSQPVVIEKATVAEN